MDTLDVIPDLLATKPATDELSRGAAVGRFILLETLGAGGMGVVYATYDPELDRKVALKLLLPRAGGSERGAQTRLLREAQALAKLSHPNVVAVHDVGTHGDRVWIAMEFVAGQTLASWVKERPRRWSESLPLLIDVARGVAAAHGAGLVHRDLKPDNVMIGQDGRVRVMDFGLAHGRCPARTEPELTSTLVDELSGEPELALLALRLTAVGSVQGTPAYMAPEQWEGEEAQAATDQFGWSVMAWELLFGERPFAGESLVALESAVRSGQRRPPPRGRRVPGWLRRVIERGLATEPGQRWPTMTALLSALARGKTRARVRTAAAALAGVALVGTGMEIYWRWDLGQRVAACEAMGAEIDSAWNDDARSRLREAFVETGVSYAETTADKVMPWLDERALAWKQARTEVCLNADVYDVWGDDLLDRAMWCLEDRQMDLESLVAELEKADGTVMRKAVTAAASLSTVDGCLNEGLLLRQPVPPLQRREVIRDVRVMLSRAQSIGFAGNSKEALRVATHAREQAAMLDWPPLLATARTQEGKQLEKLGAFEQAEAASTEAYFMAARSGAWNVAARAASNLIYIVGYRQARYEDGRVWGQHAEVALAHAGDRVGLREAGRLSNLAAIDSAAGAYAEARILNERALVVREQVLGPGHPEVATSLSNLAVLHDEIGEHAEGRLLNERALVIREHALGPGHPDVAASLNNLATEHTATGRYAEARALNERALAVWEQALGSEHPDLAISLNNLANGYIRTGEYAKAQQMHERALAIREQALGHHHDLVASSLNNLANVHMATGRYEDARAQNERALAIREKALGSGHPNTAASLNSLAEVHLAEKRPQDALPLLERAVKIYETHEGVQEAELNARFSLARALVSTGVDHFRGLVEAKTACEGFRKIGVGKAEELAEVEQWIFEHEGKR